MSVGSVALFVRDEVEEPVGSLLLAGEGHGRENGAAEPGVACLGEGGAQELEGFGRVGLGCRHGGLSGSTVLEWKELRGPRDGDGTFEREDVRVAGAEDFGVVEVHQQPQQRSQTFRLAQNRRPDPRLHRAILYSQARRDRCLRAWIINSVLLQSRSGLERCLSRIS